MGKSGRIISVKSHALNILQPITKLTQTQFFHFESYSQTQFSVKSHALNILHPMVGEEVRGSGEREREEMLCLIDDIAGRHGSGDIIRHGGERLRKTGLRLRKRRRERSACYIFLLFF